MIQYRRFKWRFLCWYKQFIVNWHLNLSTSRARNLLRNSGPIKVLIDNSVLGYRKTHRTVLLKEKINWIPGEDTYLEVLHRAPIDIERKYGKTVFENMQYLPCIVHLAQLGLLELYTSFELLSERGHQPLQRFSGKEGWFDYDLFEKLSGQIKSVDGYAITGPLEMANEHESRVILGYRINQLPLKELRHNHDKRQTERIAKSNDPLYKNLLSLFPRDKYIKDAWHIHIAEANHLFCFLTMDFKLCKNVEQNKNKEPISSLHTKVMTPKELGEHLGVSPVSPYLCEWAETDYLQSSARFRKKLKKMRNEKQAGN